MLATLPSQTVSVSSSDQITLSETHRSQLHVCIQTGRTSGWVRTRAQVLLKLGEGWNLPEVCRPSMSAATRSCACARASPRVASMLC